MSDSRVVDAERGEEDLTEASLRPLTLGDFVGQRQVCDNLRVFVSAARSRGESLDLYTLPLDGMVPSAWDAARIRDEAQAARDRWHWQHPAERGALLASLRHGLSRRSP